MSYKRLKIFAMCCMVFDHAARIFPLGQVFSPLADLLWSRGYGGLADWLLDECVSYLMYIGRLAAPIFVYCAARGFARTSNVRRYIGRVFLTAVIAQAPYTLFDLAELRVLGVEGDWRETGLNILFTLALALCVLWAHEELKRRGLVLWVIESLGTAELTGALRNSLLNVLGNYFGMLATLSDNGGKGRAGKAFQYFCYAFYPAHFAALALIGFLRPPLP